jgi:predicted DNA-binding transcriptional regulator YafY
MPPPSVNRARDGYTSRQSIDRVVWMVAVLMSRRVLTRNDYNARFGTPSMRTFRRDLLTVRQAGCIIDTVGPNCGNQGRYRLITFRPEAEAA